MFLDITIQVVTLPVATVLTIVNQAQDAEHIFLRVAPEALALALQVQNAAPLVNMLVHIVHVAHMQTLVLHQDIAAA